MNTNVKVDILHKTITVSRKFYRASMDPYTPEFEELLNLQQRLPDYAIKQAFVRRQPNRSKNPTYDRMRQIVMCYGGETELQELEQVIETARNMSKCPYSLVRGWFVRRHYDDVIAA